MATLSSRFLSQSIGVKSEFPKFTVVTDERSLDCKSKCSCHFTRKQKLNRNGLNRKKAGQMINYFEKINDGKLFAISPNSIEIALDKRIQTNVIEDRTTFMFRTEIGGQVKVVVSQKSMNYVISVELISLTDVCYQNLELHWGIFRSDSSCWVLLDSENSPSGTDLVKSERTHRKTNFVVPVGIGRGNPLPLGVSLNDDGSTNFSLFSRNAENVVLCLYDENTAKPALEIELDPYINRSGDMWHVSLSSVRQYLSYGFRCKGAILWDKGNRYHMRRILLDPYAKILGNFNYNEGGSVPLVKCLGRLYTETAFDWDGDTSPWKFKLQPGIILCVPWLKNYLRQILSFWSSKLSQKFNHMPHEKKFRAVSFLSIPMEKLMVYRLNVGRFTEDMSSLLPKDIAGTFLGVIQKLHHLKNLGVNALLLEPIFPFDELKGPYYPYNFFAPMNKYGPLRDGISACTSMKEMVKALHANGLEVLLEMVFTHTAEGGDSLCQTISFRGIDNSSYYIVDRNVESEGGNVLNCNHPMVQTMILDCLRHWVHEYHVDGFCFINSSSLAKGSDGELLTLSPLIEAIAFDPILSHAKIIADCWSPLDMQCKEIHFPHWKKWAEMNARFCYDVRNFLRGEGLLSNLATRLCGSGDIFSDGRGPSFSFNYIARNFGLPLVDLVSFSGSELSAELSWNCGEEGPTSTPVVLESRLKQIRNFLFILYISLGVPVLNMGDEYGQSTGGSTLYSNRKSFDWGSLRTDFGVQTTQYVTFLSSLRTKRSDLLQRKHFMKIEHLDWHGEDQSQPQWEAPSSKFLAVTVNTGDDETETRSNGGDLYFAINAHGSSECAVLPQVSNNMAWFCLVDTSLPYPGFFSMEGIPIDQPATSIAIYSMKPHSCTLFEARKIS
ncbi:isoamylase 2, chloroplastic isoform X3 [Amborella trichopoda]|uniref:isoamylase 2, chloroplastic isoform X3 n=1 Tax=Amborella trichopoda TaxID=13333 RepID=UPI0009BF322B|nr:isoamylase 2, chloroplastic isoform X3 [Amborella trichopoda]|eukprot:XP_020524297.1 isoamylase 2, chloroplastic isoform X3 [Amborella trichopoda]